MVYLSSTQEYESQLKDMVSVLGSGDALIRREGHEVFYIVADDICWEGGLDQSRRPINGEGRGPAERRVASLELLKTAWAGRYQTVNEEFWTGNPRRGFF